MATEMKPTGGEKTIKPPTLPKKRRRSFKLDKEAVVKHVLDNLRRDIDDRETWNQQRIDRYAKLRGWLPEKGHPLGSQASNVWIPIMMVASMRLKAGLENATKSMRPLMSSKALQNRNRDKQENIDKLIDYQLFSEIKGDTVLDDFISTLVDEGLAIAHVRWVRRDDVLHDVRSLPGVTEEVPLDFQIFTALSSFFPDMVDAIQQGTDYSWKVIYKDDYDQQREALVEFYDTEEGRVEAHVAKRIRVYDGPAIEVQDLEDIVVPMRCANCQPPSPENPFGAPYVNRICKTSLDSIKRLKKDGTYDLLDDDGLALIENQSTTGLGTGHSEEQMKEAKDAHEGLNPGWVSDNGERIIIEHYGRWDVDGDGLDEDVIFWVARDSKVLLRARYLTELYPGIPIKRPFAEARLFPVANRFYGMSLGEILEPIQDMIKGIMDQNFDWGLITNIPFFFYRPSSGLKQEEMILQPGTGYPLDRPQEDVFFPTWNRDMSWTINTLTILQQYAERISMQSDVQFGRVPTGKASALRTSGTTAALLQQGDVRSEQVLRRMFTGFSQIYQLIHKLNRRYMPPEKELRILGKSGAGEEPYVTLTPDKIDAEVDFEFNATLLNSNKEIVAESLNELMMMLVSPIAIQLGITSPDKIYTLFRDRIKARDLDPDKYLNRPPAEVLGPKYTAEEVLSLIYAGETPPMTGGSLEPPQEHMQKLEAFAQSNELGYFNPQQVQILQQWIQLMMMRLQEAMMQQQMMAAAAGFQQKNGGDMGGGEGRDSGKGGPSGTPRPDEARQQPQVGEGENMMADELGP